MVIIFHLLHFDVVLFKYYIVHLVSEVVTPVQEVKVEENTEGKKEQAKKTTAKEDGRDGSM